jgi:hypothetical protein
VYNHKSEDAALRRADLRQAMRAFLLEASSCAAVQLIGLFVRMPTPSTLVAVAPTTTTTKGKMASSSVSSAPLLSSSATSQATHQRQSNAQRLAWCAMEADRRLRQAADDAAEMNRWLEHGALAANFQGPNTTTTSSSTSRSCPGGRGTVSLTSGVAASAYLPSPVWSANARVVVVAYLDPQAREDLAVYESWQRCAEGGAGNADVSGGGGAGGEVSQTTRRLSPLRRAAFIAVSLGAPSLLLSWAERSSRCFLSNLLLPHQSLLFDLSWCINASLTPNMAVVDVPVAGAGTSAGDRGRVTSQVLFDLFAQDVLPSLKFPKGDSRCAFWLSYTSLMAALHPRTFFCSNGADLGVAAPALQDRMHRERDSSVNAEVFATTHRLLRQIFSLFFQSSSSTSAFAPGRTQDMRVLLGYGGPVSKLQRQMIHVAAGNRSGVPSTAAAATVDAALLRTRNLVDVHALFGVLVGHDRMDYYAAAAAFVRTARRRAAAPGGAAAMPTASALHGLESTLVQVRTADTTAAACMPSNVFVEAGARALARKRTRLERRRLGKGKAHLRLRNRASRKRAIARRAGQAASSLHGTSTKTVTGVAGREHESAEVMKETGAHRDSNKMQLGVPPAPVPVKKTKKETSAFPMTVSSTASATLSWSEDVG